MRYHAFQRATQAELRVRVAYRGAFSALKFPWTRIGCRYTIDNEAGNATKEAGKMNGIGEISRSLRFFLIAVD